VILAHNHPSGVAEPSRADEFLTQTLKSALQLVDVRVLDHLVVGQGRWCRSPSGACCEGRRQPAGHAMASSLREDLAALRALRAPGRASAAQRRRTGRSARAAERQRAQFARAVGPVHAAAPHRRADIQRAQPEPAAAPARGRRAAPRCARRCPTRSTSSRCCSPTTA
jgi:hypothetical protein